MSKEEFIKPQTNQEKVDILLKYFGTKAGDIDLSEIDFNDRVINFRAIKATKIYNEYQEAKQIDNNSQKADVIGNYNQEAKEIYNNNQQATKIYNEYQEAKQIDNNSQEADVIYNDNQEANKIYNDDQVIKPNYEAMSKEELIARIKELENENK